MKYVNLKIEKDGGVYVTPSLLCNGWFVIALSDGNLHTIPHGDASVISYEVVAELGSID